MSKVRIGVMGCASIAERSMIPAIKSVAALELVAVASQSRAKAERFASQFSCESICGYADLLSRNDIDAIYIPLPTGLHREWIGKALDSRKHVLAEKPLAEDYITAEELVFKARRNRLLLLENH